MPKKYFFFTSPGFLIADLWSGLRAIIQKQMPVVNFVNVLLSCQTWVKKHYAAMLMEEAQEKVRRS